MAELDPDFNIEHIMSGYEKRYILGTDRDAVAIFIELCSREIYIHGFVDDQNAGILFFHKRVFAEQQIDIKQKNTILLTRELCQEYGLIPELKDIWIDQNEGVRITPGAIAQLQEYIEHEHIKEIILYGNNSSLAEKCGRILKCLDFPQVIIMTDMENVDEERNIIPIEEIIYRDNYLILLYEDDVKDLNDKLFVLGVDKRRYGKLSPWTSPNFNTRNPLLDVHLGYTYEMNSEYPGIYIYGENRIDDFKIAVLGGSTTDSAIDSHICPWVEMLYKRCDRLNITIFNGGTSGYYSGQELVKLKRDILKLNPDMIIVYGGYNDLMQAVLQKRFKYLEYVVNFAGQYIFEADGRVLQKRKAWAGIASDKDPVDDWLENIECMHAIAESRNICFFAFMQPMLFTKKNLDLHSKTIFQTMSFHGDNTEFMKVAQQFRYRAEEIEQSHKYIYNLTKIFDEEDVYMDIVHVYDRGNEIVAECIWNVIKDNVKSRISLPRE